MNMESQENKNSNIRVGKRRTWKDFSFHSLMNVCKNSWSGLYHFYKYERSAVLHLVAAVLMLLSAWLLNMTPMEWLLIILLLFTTLSVELLNTAIEAVCDLVSPEYNEYVKIAKDAGSAATGVLSLVGIVFILVIYIPKFIQLIGYMW